MAVVTTTFSIPANTNWASSTWSIANDPSGKLHTQLSNWISAIGDSNVISMEANPGTATARGTSNYVTWRLRTRAEGDTSSDYGFLYRGRQAGTGTTTASGYRGAYNNWSSSTSNNGYGSYTTLTDNNALESFTTDSSVFIAYEASGDLPWFSYAWENITRSSRQWHLLMRCNTTNLVAGSYYPSNIGKWIYVQGDGGSLAYIQTAQNSFIVAPYKGINDITTPLRHPTPDGTYGTNYFFRLAAQYGDTHYLGDVTNDILVSNSSTGQFGDTVTLDSVTYTCIGQHATGVKYWVRSS